MKSDISCSTQKTRTINERKNYKEEWDEEWGEEAFGGESLLQGRKQEETEAKEAL